MNPLIIGIGIGFITWGLGIFKPQGKNDAKSLPSEQKPRIRDTEAKIEPISETATSESEHTESGNNSDSGGLDIVDDTIEDNPKPE